MRKVILINRLLVTKNGWSYNFQNRIEDALKDIDLQNTEIMYYPARKEILLGDLFDDFMNHAVDYARVSLSHLQELKTRFDIKHIIFLEPFQFPHMQVIGAGLNDVRFDVFMHSSLQYNDYYKFDSMYKGFYKSFPRILVNTKYTGESYGVPYKITGGILDSFDKQNKDNGKIMWAGSRVNDMVKGYDNFLKVVKRFPTIDFVMNVDVTPSKHHRFQNLKINVGLTSPENIAECKKCEYILSTAREETFGYSVMDAISVGLKPIVPNRSSYVDTIPRMFRYDSSHGIKAIWSDRGLHDMKYLREIVAPFTKEKFRNKFLEIIG